MIESELLPPEATSYLNDLEAKQAEEKAATANKELMTGLLDFCVKWYNEAAAWRRSSYEADWIIWQRNADGKYDPALAAAKKKWQAKAFVDITPSHRETIHAQLFKLAVGTKPVLEMTPGPGGDLEQAENVRDLIVRQTEKSKLAVEYDKVLEDADTYGSGHCLMYYEKKVEDRVIKVPRLEPFTLRSAIRHISGQAQVVGFDEEIQPQVVYSGVRIQHIPIFDFFPDPKALGVNGNMCARRFKATYGEIVAGVEAGYYFKEAAEILKDLPSDEKESQEQQQLDGNRGIADSNPSRVNYGRNFELLELYGRLPKKWVLVKGEPVDDPEKLVPARIIFHKNVVCAVEFNKDYDGEPPIHKLDYFHVNGRYYGRGLPEMLRNPQSVINEVVNQRLDEGSLAISSGLAVNEKALSDPRELEDQGPGMVLRLKSKELGPNGDVRNAVMPFERPDVKRNAGFSEVYEWERIAQERTSANRVTLGTVGQVHDSNNTLGGQEILKEQAGEKFAYIAMMQEFSFMQEVFRSYWKLIYQNIEPEEVVTALGPERAMNFQLMTPEQIENDYSYAPAGIFQMENKAVLQARLQELFAQFAAYPWANPMAFFDKIAKNANIDPKSLKYSPEEMQQMLMAQATMEQAKAPIAAHEVKGPPEKKDAKAK